MAAFRGVFLVIFCFYYFYFYFYPFGAEAVRDAGDPKGATSRRVPR